MASYLKNDLNISTNVEFVVEFGVRPGGLHIGVEFDQCRKQFVHTLGVIDDLAEKANCVGMHIGTNVEK